MYDGEYLGRRRETERKEERDLCVCCKKGKVLVIEEGGCGEVSVCVCEWGGRKRGRTSDGGGFYIVVVRGRDGVATWREKRRERKKGGRVRCSWKKRNKER